MRQFWRGLRRFWIVTLGGALRALFLLGSWRRYPHARTGIQPIPSSKGRGRGPPRSGGRVRGYTVSGQGRIEATPPISPGT